MNFFFSMFLNVGDTSPLHKKMKLEQSFFAGLTPGLLNKETIINNLLLFVLFCYNIWLLMYKKSHNLSSHSHSPNPTLVDSQPLSISGPGCMIPNGSTKHFPFFDFYHLCYSFQKYLPAFLFFVSFSLLTCSMTRRTSELKS